MRELHFVIQSTLTITDTEETRHDDAMSRSLPDHELYLLVVGQPGHLLVAPQPGVRHPPDPLHLAGLDLELAGGGEDERLEAEAVPRQLDLNVVRIIIASHPHLQDHLMTQGAANNLPPVEKHEL